MDDRLEEIKERYEHMDGSGCNPAVFDGLSKNGLEIVAQDMGALIAEAERLRAENKRLKQFYQEIDHAYRNADALDTLDKQLKQALQEAQTYESI